MGVGNTSLFDPFVSCRILRFHVSVNNIDFWKTSFYFLKYVHLHVNHSERICNLFHSRKKAVDVEIKREILLLSKQVM